MKKCKLSYVFSLLVISIMLISCSSDDDSQIETDQFLIANVNGVSFASDITMQPLGFSRILMPSGRINLHVRALSSDGDIVEILIENFKGMGKYHFGDNFYNKSWVKFESPAKSELWSVEPGKALNRITNFIEIVSVRDGYIEGKFSCNELMNSLDGSLGAMDGEFKMVYLD